MGPWFEDDAFWADMEPFLFSGMRTAEQTPAEVERIALLLQPTPGAAILDLCCGPGRHSLELAARGFRVTGVDRSSRYLEIARTRAARRELQIELVQSDMREFERPGAFDIALNLFTSFGYFEDPADDRRVLQHLRASLRPGGKLLMDMAGKETTARKFQARDWHHDPDRDEYLLEERTVRDGWSWIENRWTLIRGADRRTFVIGVRLYSGLGLAQALRGAGFSHVQLYGSFEGTPYDHQAQRLVAVAVR